jgi:NADH:ubiquinone oxidoreductase subunit E
MPGEKDNKTAEEAQLNLSVADKEVLDYSAKEEAEADRIFNEANGITPEGEEKKPGAEEEEVKKVEKQEAKKPEGEVDDTKGLNPKPGDEDLLADLTVENAKKRISAAQSKMHESNKNANTSSEEATRLAKENADLKALIEQAATKTEETAPEQKAVAPQETDDEVEKSIEAIKAEYPEIGGPMIELLRRQQNQNKVLTEKLDGIEVREQKREADAKTLADNTHLTAISDAHPDFREISNEPLLDEWINSLPTMEKVGAQAIRKDGATDAVIELLTSFKKANGYLPPDEVTKKPVNSKVEKAKKMSTPSFKKAKEVDVSDRKIKFTQDQISKWTEQEWADNEAAVDAALAEGLVV